MTEPTRSAGPVAPTARAVAALHPLPADAVQLSPTGLLGGWQARNAAATLPHCVDNLDTAGNLANLRRVVGDGPTAFAGMWFADTDVYKTLEAAAWELGRTGTLSPRLSGFLADTASLLEKAQDPDGYLDSYYQSDHRDRQWTELHFSHEMYCAGHLIQAAVAAARAPGTDAAAVQQLVGVARRFADLLVRRYGPDGTAAICGHPEIETALVELYRLTGHEPYLDLAARFVDRRGHGLIEPDKLGPRYYQDHQPVRTADEVTGHVVRQLYLLAGAVDVAVETHDSELLTAAERLWDSALGSKTYLTGGQGSRHRDESFGDPYELPPDRAYAETCAAIGSFQWAWRLLLATGRARYADEMERLLHNGIAGSTGVDGTSFFYSNPLQLRTGHDGSHEDAPSQRLGWYSCACCPPNLARLMASLHAYLATGDQSGLQLHLYATGTFGPVEVSTRYPWDEQITISLTEDAATPWTLALRVPSWCADARLTVNGEPDATAAEDGYLRLTRAWRTGDQVVLTLAMPPRLVRPHPRIDAVRGTAALTRGPLVYCLEHADVSLPGVVLEDLALDPGRPIEVVHREDALAPVTLLAPVVARPAEAAPLYRTGPRDEPPATTAGTVTAIPYFLWANRAPGPMRVWIPTAAPEA
ncbi:beta-L-arabinofuranosidase domain-containing protein [Actinoplanes sp. NPDC048967]|uniref:glycoside hydrolase family 127 protein n=1 Tax=Actinoplanes sp. NPDC048967 TaxID=3155269 RepID=UPI0033F649D1